jgi:uncharacterized protein YndB with AHSA1/START domain
MPTKLTLDEMKRFVRQHFDDFVNKQNATVIHKNMTQDFYDHDVGASELDAPVIEPKAGGRWYERSVDGVECEIGKVLVWEPPTRLVLIWQLTADWKYDRNLVTEVEVRFIPDGAGATRVELEHRNLDRYGDRADTVRQQIDAPDGWNGLLQLFAQAAAQL